MELRNNIKKLRKIKHLTQDDLAVAIGTKRANIGAYEEGRCEPGIETANNIAKHFNVSLDDLVNKKVSSEEVIKFQ